MARKIEYLTGSVVGDFGVLFLSAVEPKDKRKRSRALFKCKCGKEFECLVESVKGGRTTSCGCRQKILSSKANTKHGKSKRNGVTNLYERWCHIKQRCYDKNHPRYKDWGGRGIRVCDEWKNDFSAFEMWAISNGYSREMQIDRIDNDGDYSPINCRFITPQDNSRNKRTRSDNKTGISGVTFDSKLKKHRVRITLKDKTRKHIGFYVDFFEACCARKSAEIRLWKN